MRMPGLRGEADLVYTAHVLHMEPFHGTTSICHCAWGSMLDPRFGTVVPTSRASLARVSLIVPSSTSLAMGEEWLNKLQ
ncbi:hypothetical protein VN12_15590 [Pirellula sp. SH-Sr6A]|nr:hypothetical protein VN12_15590 [Pirellula sp. SH-Sr6A]